MNRYQILIEYVGTNYNGWQIQRKGKTIQGRIQNTISKIFKEKINIIGSGRTDSGVHALEQSAHFDTSAKIKDSNKFLKSINHFLNIHASILPKFRGAAPIQRAIMSQDIETGISFMKINEHLDAGPVLETYKIKIDLDLNATELQEKLSQLAALKIIENIDSIKSGKANFKEQDHSKATYAEKINKAEGKIFWNDNAKKIIGKINGLHPNPGAYFIFEGDRYKILKAEIGNGTGPSGKVLNDKLEIACSNNESIKVIEIQKEGKKIQEINEFLNGSKIGKGCILNE